MGKRYAILGGGGSFGIHSALYLLDHADPELVMGIGRNLMRPEPFSLNIEKRPRYEYHAYHVTYELDLLLELLDRKKPQVIVNFAAQGEGAVSWKHSWRFFETNSMALARLAEELMKRDWLERFIQIGTSEMYGSVEHADHGGRADQAVEPLRRLQGGVRHVSALGAQVPQIPDEHHPAVERLLSRPVAASRDSEGGDLRAEGREAAAARRRPRREILHPRPRSRPRHPLVAEKAPLGTVYNAGPALPTSIREVVERTAKALGVPFDQLCEVTGDRLGPGFALLARLVGDQTRHRLGAADRLGRRSRRDGRLGPQIFRRAEDLADRLHVAGVRN